MSQPPQPPFSGEPQPGEPIPGRPLPAQPQYPGTPYPSPYQPPYAGQPNPDVPSSVPPQPGQPPYAYPGYGYPPPVAPPKAKSRTLPIVLTSIAIFLVLCLGGGTAVVLVLSNNDDKLTALDGTPGPSATAEATDEATEEPTTPPAATVEIVEPKTLGGRAKLNSKDLKSTVDLMKTVMSSYPGATDSVGALYGRLGTRNVVLMTAAEASVDDPADTVDNLLASGGLTTKVTGITSASTGSLGGVAKCGNANTGGQKVAVCVWADDGSLGLIFYYFKSASTVKGEFPKARAEVEKKA